MKNLFLKKSNKGAALVSVMIAVAFISILATSLLYMSVSNYKMKVQNINSKKNYYETESVLTQTSVALRNALVKDSDPLTAIKNYSQGGTFDKSASNKYDCNKLAKLVFDETELLPGTVTNEKRYKFEGNADSTKITDKVDNNIYRVKSTDSLCKINYSKNTSTSVETYTLKNVMIEQETPDGFKNNVKTDINLSMLAQTGTTQAKGGVGEFSMLMDAPLDFNGSNFASLTIQGNSFVGSYDGHGVLKIGSTEYGTFAKPGSSALNVCGNSAAHFVGDYSVVYGDIKLSGNAAMYVCGNLTVYGDINISENANLIVCEGGKIYMPNFILPGRTTACSIKYAGGTTNLDKHVYPSDTAVVTVPVDKYISFCGTLGLDDDDDTNNGLIPQLLNKVSCGSGSYYITDLYADNPCKVDGTFYGKNVSVSFNKETNLNGGNYNNQLVFNLVDGVKFNESATDTTIISKYPIKCEQVHSLTLTKLGGAEFDYITAGKDANSIYNRKENPFVGDGSMKIEFKGSHAGYVSLPHGYGDFFDPNCNKTVNDMFTYSTGEGGGDVSSVSTSLSFKSFVKDYE